MTFDLTGKLVWLAGHRGMVGRAILRRLDDLGYATCWVDRDQCDLRDQTAVERQYQRFRPDAVIVAAAKVGGIAANSAAPADFLYDNLAIATNLIRSAYAFHVEKLLFLGSSCIYPREAPQPMREEYLLTGPFEPTNEWYAIAKIAGIKLCQAYRRQHGCDFISCLPTNLYGPGDRFNPETGHVVPALMAKMHAAKMNGDREVSVWGTGTPRRELLYVDDLADACVHLLRHYSDEMPINIGYGTDFTIAEFAEAVRLVVGYEGRLVYDPERPDGPPQKWLDSTRMNELGWRASTGIGSGLWQTYEWYRDACAS